MACGLLPVFPVPSIMPMLICKTLCRMVTETHFLPQILRPLPSLENPTSHPDFALCHLWTTDKTSPPGLSSCCYPWGSSAPPFLLSIFSVPCPSTGDGTLKSAPMVFITPASFLLHPCWWSPETTCLTLPSNWSPCLLQPTSCVSTIG